MWQLLKFHHIFTPWIPKNANAEKQSTPAIIYTIHGRDTDYFDQLKVLTVSKSHTQGGLASIPTSTSENDRDNELNPSLYGNAPPLLCSLSHQKKAPRLQRTSYSFSFGLFKIRLGINEKNVSIKALGIWPNICPPTCAINSLWLQILSVYDLDFSVAALSTTLVIGFRMSLTLQASLQWSEYSMCSIERRRVVQPLSLCTSEKLCLSTAPSAFTAAWQHIFDTCLWKNVFPFLVQNEVGMQCFLGALLCTRAMLN